jgi:hypothetical protein
MSQATITPRRFDLRTISLVVLALLALAAVGGIFWSQSRVSALETQISGFAPASVVQAGVVQPAPAEAAPSGWDTAESIRGGLQLVATYDSSGPAAWDAAKHPLVFMTSEGRGYGHRPSKTNEKPGVQIIDATTKETVGSALFDLGGEPTRQPHGLGISPNGQWIYIGFADKKDDVDRQLTLIINAKTLKLDKVLAHKGGQNLHHTIGFINYAGKEVVVLEYGFGSDGGPHFLIDPNDDNRVVKALTIEDIGYKMGHSTTPAASPRSIWRPGM